MCSDSGFHRKSEMVPVAAVVASPDSTDASVSTDAVAFLFSIAGAGDAATSALSPSKFTACVQDLDGPADLMRLLSLPTQPVVQPEQGEP